MRELRISVVNAPPDINLLGGLDMTWPVLLSLKQSYEMVRVIKAVNFIQISSGNERILHSIETPAQSGRAFNSPLLIF
jgi:hypothetical protein